MIGRAMIAGAALAMAAVPAMAAKSPQELCAGGQLASVRINTLKSPDAAAAYDKAAKKHVGWYRKRGMKENRLLTGPVLLFDRATGEWSASPNEMASLHLNQNTAVPPEQRDAEWNAYVAEYRASSDLTVDKFVCLREPLQ